MNWTKYSLVFDHFRLPSINLEKRYSGGDLGYFLFGYKLGFPSILTGEILVFYLPIGFFYYLVKLIIFPGRAGFLVYFPLMGIQGELFKRKKFYPFLYGFRDMTF